MQFLDSKFSENIVREPHDDSLKLQVIIAFQEPAAIPADEACDIIRWLTTDMFSTSAFEPLVNRLTRLMTKCFRDMILFLFCFGAQYDYISLSFAS